MENSFIPTADLTIRKSDLPEYFELRKILSKFEDNEENSLNVKNASKLISLLQSLLSDLNEQSMSFSGPENNLMERSLNLLSKFINNQTENFQSQELNFNHIIEENANLKDEIIRLQDDLKISTEKSNNLGQYKLLYNSIKTENEALKLDNEVMQEVREKYEKKTEKLSARLKEFKTALKNLVHDYTAVQKQNEQDRERLFYLEEKMKGNENNNEFTLSQQELQIKENEINSLKQVFSIFEKNLDDQNEELNRESEQRNKLTSAIFKLQQILIEDEKLIEKKDKEIKELKERIEKQNELINPKEREQQKQQEVNINQNNSQLTNDLLFERICKQILVNLPKKYNKDSIEKILLDGTDSEYYQKILNSYEEIYKEHEIISKENEKEKDKRIEMLNDLVYSELEFIEEIANNKQIQQWINQPHDDDDKKVKIIEQSKRIANYIMEKSIQYSGKEFNFIKKMLQTSNDMKSFEQDMEKFFTQIEDEKKTTGNELFLLLKQSLCANDILRCLTIETNSKLLKQEATIEELQKERRLMEQEKEDFIYDQEIKEQQQKEKEQKLKEELEKLKQEKQQKIMKQQKLQVKQEKQKQKKENDSHKANENLSNDSNDKKKEEELEKYKRQINSIKAVLDFAKGTHFNSNQNKNQKLLQISDSISVSDYSDEFNDEIKLKDKLIEELENENKALQQKISLISSEETTQIEKLSSSSLDSLNSPIDNENNNNKDENKPRNILKNKKTQRIDRKVQIIDDMLDKVGNQMENDEQFLKQKNEEINSLKKEIQEKEKQLNNANDEINKLKMINENQINAIKIKQDNELAAYKQEMDKEREEIIVIMNNTNDSLRLTNVKLNKKCLQLKKKLNDLNTKYSTETTELQQIIDDLERDKNISNNKMQEMKENVENMQNSILSLQNKINSLENEKIKLLFNLKTAENNSKRQEQALIDQCRMRDIAVKAKYDSLLAQETQKLNDFQQNISQILNCSPTEIEEFLQKVIKQIKQINQIKNKLAVLQYEYTTCKDLFNVYNNNNSENDQKITTNSNSNTNNKNNKEIQTNEGEEEGFLLLKEDIENVLKRNKEYLDQINELNEQIKSFYDQKKELNECKKYEIIANEWSNWGRRVHIYVIDSYVCVKTDQEIRDDLENIIFSSAKGISMKKTIDSLRAQKCLILQNPNILIDKTNERKPILIQNDKNKINSKTFKEVLICIISIKKIMKKSGYSSKFDALSNNINTNSVHMPPLFSNFIV